MSALFTKSLLPVVISVSVLFAAGSVHAEDAKLDIKNVKKLIKDGKPEQALKLMEPHTDKFVGDKTFDYYYGIAQADAGNHGEAIFAFERVLAQNPDFAGARLELARAYFNNEENVNAQREFESALSLNPPEGTRKVIQKYLDKIAGDKDNENRPWAVQLAVQGGHDSNANAATSDKTFLGFDLSPESQAKASTYMHLKALGIYGVPIVKGHDLLLTAQYDTRSNFDASFADTANLGINAAMQHQLDKAVINYGISYNSTSVAGSANNNTLAITASVGDNAADGESSAVFFRYANIRYTSSLSSQDVDQIVGGLSRTYNMGAAKNKLTVSGILGADTALDKSSSSSKIILGARAGLGFVISPTFNWGAGTGLSISPYDKKAVDGSTRTDTNFSYEVTGNYLLSKRWLIKGGLYGNNNSSTTSLYSYDKTYFYVEGVWTY